MSNSSDDPADHVRATVLRYVSSEAALIDPETLRRRNTGWLYCLFAQVCDDTPDDIVRNVELVVPICVKHRGLIVDITASILFVAFGVHGDSKKKSSDNSRAAPDELVASLKEKIRVVTFDGELSYGNIGTINA